MQEIHQPLEQTQIEGSGDNTSVSALNEVSDLRDSTGAFATDSAGPDTASQYLTDLELFDSNDVSETGTQLDTDAAYESAEADAEAGSTEYGLKEASVTAEPSARDRYPESPNLHGGPFTNSQDFDASRQSQWQPGDRGTRLSQLGSDAIQNARDAAFANGPDFHTLDAVAQGFYKQFGPNGLNDFADRLTDSANRKYGADKFQPNGNYTVDFQTQENPNGDYTVQWKFNQPYSNEDRTHTTILEPGQPARALPEPDTGNYNG